jgi:hypothetical protein
MRISYEKISFSALNKFYIIETKGNSINKNNFFFLKFTISSGGAVAITSNNLSMPLQVRKIFSKFNQLTTEFLVTIPRQQSPDI